jgi:serine/threonine protein kinase
MSQASSSGQQSQLTIGIGTVGYMPSEQSNGNPRFSSDIYAVGMIAIQALTGLFPTQLTTNPHTGEINWRNHVQVSPKLAEVLDKMIKYDYRYRYQSAQEALKAVADSKILGKLLKNRYKIFEELGSGGFGKTYKAEDTEKFNEICVIKQFAPQVQGITALEKATELFELEARQLQKLGEHPQIPTLLAYFEESQRLYLVQQLIDGHNLSQEIQRQGTYNEQKIWDFLLQLLEVIKIVHQHKVIHRDIKPENIIRRHSDGKLVLIDFGASKQLTQSIMAPNATIIGSPGYSPQEQLESGKADATTDLYSLGTTCIHLLTGIHPYNLLQQHDYAWVNNWQEFLKQPVSKKLASIIDKLLQRNQNQRYQSVDEALQAINQLHNQRKLTINPKVIARLFTLLVAIFAGAFILTHTLNLLPSKQEVSPKKETPAF